MTPTVLLALAPLCSFATFSGTIEVGQPFFIATSLADTARSGAGRMEHLAPNGLRPELGPIHGQVFVVERVGGIEVPAEVIPGARVIVVPWHFGPDCRRFRSAASARFLAPGERRFVSARLRERDQWAADVPTFDATILHAQVYDPAWPGNADVRLEELFQVHELLPTRAAVQLDDWRALEPVLAWARADSSRWQRRPLRGLLEMLIIGAETARVTKAPSPMRGTWEVRVLLPTDREIVFWMRTATMPLAPAVLFPGGIPFAETAPPWTYRAGGQELAFWVGSRLEDLPAPGSRPHLTFTYPLQVSATDSSRVRPAWFEIGPETWPSLADQELNALLREYSDRITREARPGAAYVPPAGAMREEADGSAAFEQVVELSPGHRLVIRGRRHSLDAIAGNGMQ